MSAGVEGILPKASIFSLAEAMLRSLKTVLPARVTPNVFTNQLLPNRSIISSNALSLKAHSQGCR
jgi:hypothetical protein